MNQFINVFRIAGLDRLSAMYRIADVIGLDREQTDYFRSTDRLVSLSRTLRRPVSFLELSDAPVIMYPDNTPIPTTLDMGTRILTLVPRRESVAIDFTHSSRFDPIRLRILRFAIEEHLRATHALWQPGAGQAFFEREPTQIECNIGLYVGTRLRPMVLPDGGIGVCIDKTSRLVAIRPIPKSLSREIFDDRWKGQRCIYRYGDAWYEIRCEMLARQTVSEYPIRQVRGHTNLLRYVLDNAAKPVPKYVANLDPGGDVIVYRNARGEERAVPSELCFPIHDTEDVRRTGLGRATIVEPDERMRWIREFARSRLNTVRIGEARLAVEDDPIACASARFSIPDLSFGNGVTLSVTGTPGAWHVQTKDLGRSRIRLLEDGKAGPLIKHRFDQQYLVLPESAAASFGPAFEADLRTAVHALHPEGGYVPTLVTYDDTCRRTFVEQARAIRAALAHVALPGFAVVMIHRCKARRRAEDALAAFVLRSFREFVDTVASVIHYDTAERLYEATNDAAGGRHYKIRSDQTARATGYFRNVAINKVLLTNQFWPFGLAQPLRADLIIGIDVKNNSCGVLAVGNRGRHIGSDVQISKQKEQLGAAQVCAYLCRIIRQEVNPAAQPTRHIVIHRDGRAWPSEIGGARKAIDILRAEETLPDDATLTVLEIHKRSSLPLRIFGGDGRNGPIAKPNIGDALIANANEAFVCTTGWPFPRPGTPNPLQLRRVYGSLPIEDCARDVFALSNLAWTRPEDCSRFPVTLRLVDRFLADEASEYDADALAFNEDHLNEETA